MVLENEMFSFVVGSEFLLACFPKPVHPVAKGESTEKKIWIIKKKKKETKKTKANLKSTEGRGAGGQVEGGDSSSSCFHRAEEP